MTVPGFNERPTQRMQAERVFDSQFVPADTADTLLASSEEAPMAVYRIEKDLDGQTTDAEPWAVVEVGAMAGDTDVESLRVISTWPTEADARGELDRLVSDGEADSSDTEVLGGKPNPGTKKDKRLHENDPSMKKKGKKSALQEAMDLALRQRMTPEQRAAADAAEGESFLDPAGSTADDQAAPAAGATQVTAAAKVKDQTPVTAGWKGTICVEGIVSGDQREFSKGALTWADPPIPLRWKKEDSHGGVNDVTVAVGTITNIQRVGNKIQGEGVFDLGSEDGREAHRRVGAGMLRGISIDADDITDADIEFVWGDEDEEADDDDLFAMLFASPEKIVFHAGRVRAATLVDIPAFVEAYIGLTADGTQDTQIVLDGGVTVPDDLESAVVLDEKVRRASLGATVASAGITAAAAVSADLARPPREWFDDPKLSVPMNVIVTDEGRVYGHAAHWDQCHIGHPEMCITPPYEDRHPYYMTGEVVCADGSRVQVGQITVGTGHAPLPYSAQRAAEHYDNTGAAVADVTIGNDEWGIWMAGALRPGTDPNRIRELQASGKVSGDWRRIAGSLRLVGLLGVNVAGFQTPQVRSRVASGVQLALVAAGLPRLGSSTVDIERAAMRYLMARMARQVHGAKES